MSVRNLDKLFNPGSVVLIGAADRPGSIGAIVLRNLRRAGFQGDIMLVDRDRRMLDGMPVYPDVASLPRGPDLAVIATPPDTVPALVAELGARGTRAAIILAPGFGEPSDAGQSLRLAALDAARPYLLRLVGPNGIGVIVPRIGLDASVSHLAPPAGDIAFVSQSGAMIGAMLDWAAPRGIGFSHVVSLGEMADVDIGDMLDFLAADPHARAILLYIESVTHGRKFMSAARAAARGKPVLVLKAGRSGAGSRAAASYSGVLAASDMVYDAAFRRAGMLRVGGMAELFNAAETLALTGTQIGDGLAILTNSGSAGVLAADALDAAVGLHPTGLSRGGRLAPLSAETRGQLDQVLPAYWSRDNPVDILGDAPGERYAAALEVLLGDPGIDSLLILNCPTGLAEPAAAADAVIATLAAAAPDLRRGRNILTAWLGGDMAAAARRRFNAARMASYETPEAAVSGFFHRVEYQRNQALLIETPPLRLDPFEPDVARVRDIFGNAVRGGRSWLDAGEAAAVLAAYGIPQPAARDAADADEAAAAAAAISFPVALKIRSPDIVEESDVDGVMPDLADAASVRTAAAALVARARAIRPQARIEGLFVQQMVRRPGAVALRVRLLKDAIFGPVIIFGQGGSAADIVEDSAAGLPPLNLLLARGQMAQTRVWRLLQAHRSRPAAAIDVLAEVLIRVGQLAAEHPEIRELDINPLLADAAGVVALDVHIRVAAATVEAAAGLAIAPYPRHLESAALSRDGVALQMRPLRPEDEPLLHDLAAHMSAEDLRLRFFTPVRGLSHAVAARLTQIDYDREMALLAEHEGVALGIAHFFADPDRLQAEYAIAVRSDWQGRGIGYLLMTRLIEIARQCGIGELVGEVLRENGPMREMCSTLGFTVAPDPDDPAILRVRKPLAAK
jgi:acetyltransferase